MTSGLVTRFRTYKLYGGMGMQLSVPSGRNRRAHFIIFGNPDADRSLHLIGRKAAAGHLARARKTR